MNRNDIYRKTPAGEDVMVHRAKVEERQQRMILVLIDGKTNVGEMSEKVGDSALTESAIATLEAGGFIVLDKAGDNTPPLAAPLHKPAKLSQFSTFGAKDSPRPATITPPPTQQPAQQATHQPPAPQHPVPQGITPAPKPTPASAPTLQPSPQPAALQNVPTPQNSPAPVIVSPPPPPPAPTLAEILAEAAQARAASSAQPIQTGDITLPSFYKTPPPMPPDMAVDVGVENLLESEDESKSRRRSLWIKRAGFVLVGILLVFSLGFAAISQYSYDAERQALEEWLSRGLSERVHVGQISPVFSPRPALELRQVQIGDVPGRNQIEVVRLPGLFARIFGLPFNADDKVEISGGTLDAALLAKWRGGSAPGGMAKAYFRQMEIHLGEYPVATFDGDILFTPDGGLRSAYLRSKPLQLEITPLGKAFAVTVLSANGWQPVPDSPLQIQNFSGTVLIYSDHLFLEKGELRLLGGRYEGNLKLNWQNGKVRELNGQGVLSGIRINDLLNATGFVRPAVAADAALELEGDLSGALRFHTSGDTSELWRKNLEAHGEMKVDRSVLRGMDLIRLMRGGGKGKITRRSGKTSFSRLDFNVSLDGEGLRLDKLQLRATSLRGEGSVKVDAKGELSGRVTLLLFDGEGGPGSELLLGGHYPLLNAELRETPDSASLSAP